MASLNSVDDKGKYGFTHRDYRIQEEINRYRPVEEFSFCDGLKLIQRNGADSHGQGNRRSNSNMCAQQLERLVQTIDKYAQRSKKQKA